MTVTITEPLFLCMYFCRRRWTPVPWCRLYSAAWPTTPTCPKVARSTRRPRTTRLSHHARNPSRYLAVYMLNYTCIHTVCAYISLFVHAIILWLGISYIKKYTIWLTAHVSGFTSRLCGESVTKLKFIRISLKTYSNKASVQILTNLNAMTKTVKAQYTCYVSSLNK